MLRAVGASEFGHLIEEGLQKELIVSCAVKGSKAKSYLDVPGGVLASDETGAAIQAGAYSSLPDWSEYMFDPETGTCMGKSAAGAWVATFSQPSTVASTQSEQEQENQPALGEALAEERDEPGVPAFRSQYAREIRIGLPRAARLASQDEE